MVTKEELARAIRANCVECCGGSRKLVRSCAVTGCPLHPFRVGDRAGGTGEMPGQTNIFQLLARMDARDA